MLQFYKSCPLWLTEVYRNEETTYRELKLFENSKLFEDVLQKVSTRLGYVQSMGMS